MAEEKKEGSGGLFAGTIFEGGLTGKKAEAHGEGIDVEHAFFWHYVFHTWSEWGISRALMIWLVYIAAWAVLAHEVPDLGSFAAAWLFGTAPVWLPLAALVGAWITWIWYVRAVYISGRDARLLEIKLPREILKSPRAMEIALGNIYFSSGEGTFIDRMWLGQVRPWFSFELVSLGGNVHLYVWTWKAYQPAVELALYSQYPEIEIQEVEDYASRFELDFNRYALTPTDYKLSKSNAFPLRTYIDFELDRDPKEEFKVEPLSQIFELLSALKPNEQMWIQLVFRQTGKNDFNIFKPGDQSKEWRAEIEKEVKKIRIEASKALDDKDPNKSGFPRPTWQQTQQMEAMERNGSKLPFDVGGRGIYICDKTGGSPRGPIIASMLNLWRPFTLSYLNSFSLVPSRGAAMWEYPWQDFNDIRHHVQQRRYLDSYRRRSYFHSPWRNPYSIMSAEVLATIFHFPSQTVQAPGLNRIPATKAEPPPNLPK